MMANFASQLQLRVLDRPVIDQSGLTDRFDFTLNWTPDDFQSPRASAAQRAAAERLGLGGIVVSCLPDHWKMNPARAILFLTFCNASIQCILGQPGRQPTEPLKNQQVDLTAMSDDALAATYPETRKSLTFAGGSFSPDGTLLAIILSDIVRDGGQQVWRYDLRTRTFAPITEAPQRQRFLMIRDMFWSGDGTLYIKAEGSANSMGAPSFFSSKSSAARELSQVPADISNRFARRFAASCWAAQYCAENGGQALLRRTFDDHGTEILWARSSGSQAWQEIAGGGPEFSSALFDSRRSQVIFSLPGALVTFQLRTRQQQPLLTLDNPEMIPRLIDQTVDGTVAYVVWGSCDGKIATRDLPTARPQVCFAKPR